MVTIQGKNFLVMQYLPQITVQTGRHNKLSLSFLGTITPKRM